MKTTEKLQALLNAIESGYDCITTDVDELIESAFETARLAAFNCEPTSEVDAEISLNGTRADGQFPSGVDFWQQGELGEFEIGVDPKTLETVYFNYK